MSPWHIAVTSKYVWEGTPQGPAACQVLHDDRNRAGLPPCVAADTTTPSRCHVAAMFAHDNEGMGGMPAPGPAIPRPLACIMRAWSGCTAARFIRVPAA